MEHGPVTLGFHEWMSFWDILWNKNFCLQWRWKNVLQSLKSLKWRCLKGCISKIQFFDILKTKQLFNQSIRQKIKVFFQHWLWYLDTVDSWTTFKTINNHMINQRSMHLSFRTTGNVTFYNLLKLLQLSCVKIKWSHFVKMFSDL